MDQRHCEVTTKVILENSTDLNSANNDNTNDASDDDSSCNMWCLLLLRQIPRLKEVMY